MRNGISVIFKYPDDLWDDFAFRRFDAETFGRDKDGSTSTRGGLDPILRPYDEYCVHVISSLLGSDSVREDTQCISKPVDLTVDAALMDAAVKQQLAGCDALTRAPDTPPGGSGSAAAGSTTGSAAQTEGGGDGCSVGTGRGFTGEATVLGLLLALVRARRSRRRVLPHRK